VYRETAALEKVDREREADSWRKRNNGGVDVGGTFPPCECDDEEEEEDLGLVLRGVGDDGSDEPLDREEEDLSLAGMVVEGGWWGSATSQRRLSFLAGERSQHSWKGATFFRAREAARCRRMRESKR
jgi:hypothetical protein